MPSLQYAYWATLRIAQGGQAEGAVADADVRLTSDVPALASSVSSLLSQMLGGIVDVLLGGPLVPFAPLFVVLWSCGFSYEVANQEKGTLLTSVVVGYRGSRSR